MRVLLCGKNPSDVFEFGGVQKDLNLVDIEKCCKLISAKHFFGFTKAKDEPSKACYTGLTSPNHTTSSFFHRPGLRKKSPHSDRADTLARNILLEILRVLAEAEQRVRLLQVGAVMSLLEFQGHIVVSSLWGSSPPVEVSGTDALPVFLIFHV